MSDFTLCSIEEDYWVNSCVPAIMVPVKGKKCPKLPSETHIFRSSPNSFGDSDMVGYHAEGGYYATPKPGRTYKSYITVYGNKSDRYNTGFGAMVRCEGNVAIAIHMANPSWYPDQGQVRVWDARLRGYARPHKVDGGSYVMLVENVQSYWYSRSRIPDTVADMSIDEIIDYMDQSGAKWHNNDQPEGYGDYVTVDGKSYSASYAIWAKNLVREPKLNAPTLARYGEHITLNGLSFQRAKLEAGIYEAYMHAVEALPKDEMNWFATILDLVQLIIACVTGNIKVVAKTLPQLAADAWLSYRYVYNTTRMDVEDMGELRSRTQKLDSMCKIMRNPEISTFGVANADGAIIRVSLTYSASEVLQVNNFLDNTWRLLAYDAWDLIPFSFIVDWFYSVGDLLHDDSLHSYAMKLQPAAAWCSVSYTNVGGDGTNYKRYFRYRLAGVPGRPDTYSYRTGPNATTLSVKHSIDSLAIVIGML